MELREIADWVVRPRLPTLPGVSQVILIGGDVRQYRVMPDLAAMNILQITGEQLAQALRQFGTNTGGGYVDHGGREYLIRNVGQKQPGADSTRLTKQVELAMADLARVVPADVRMSEILFRQADFIQISVGNSILASLVTSITVTPVLCSYLLPRMKRLAEQDGLIVCVLERGNAGALEWCFRRPRFVFAIVAVGEIGVDDG